MITSTRATLLTLMLAGVLIPKQAVATVVSHTFCFKYGTTGFTDRTVGDFLVGTTYVANGMKFKIIRNSNGDAYSWNVDPNGCKTITLNDESWTVKAFRTAEVNGNTIEVRGPGGGIYVRITSTSFVPTSNGTTTWTNSTDVTQIMAAGTFALAAHNGGLSGETYSFRDSTAACPVNAAGCFHSGNDTINIGSSLIDYKSGITHEMGHAMSYYANVFQLDCDNTYAPCPSSGHSMASKEFQSCAAVEGTANAYSAIAFNDENQSDCDIEKHYSIDWNGDGTLDAGETRAVNCEGGTTATTPSVPGADYLGFACLASGITNNRGTEYDWMRAIWDLYSDDGLNFGVYLDIWDGANPGSWNTSGDGTGPAYPAQRMSTAAGNISASTGTKWDNNASDNGIDR